jgi:hypothetical protein
MAVDAAFAGLLADKRSELRAPPAHVSIDDLAGDIRRSLA